MSDLYDSLEDECDENKNKTGSPEEIETVICNDNTIKSESPKKYSFYLKPNIDEDDVDFQFKKSFQTEKHFLPKIEKNLSKKGVESVRNLVLQNQILNEQGLQLNNDGSITKSPRREKDELPFITREYRNLQFQKKKTYADSKKILSPNTQKKVVKKDGDETSTKKFNSAKRKIETCEKIMSGNSIPSKPSQIKADKRFASNYNMTDSMKEKLLQTQKESLQKNFTRIRNFGKTNNEMSSSKTSNLSHQNIFSKEKSGDQVKTHRLEKNSNCSESIKKESKTSKAKIHGELSDISLTTLRPKLNYSERLKLENGFNIFHLKQLNKKVESDTNRSNFGDSVVEDLPEVSGVPESCGNTAREDEELFYQKLIEKDKCLKQQIHLSARSEGPVHVGKIKRVIDERKNFFRTKNISKSKFVNLDIEVDNLVNSFKKSSHFCPANSSTNASKVELALKGKTYGYLANARNIFRLKAQSELKLNAPEKGEDLKMTRNTSHSKKVSNLSRGSSIMGKQNSPSVGIFPNVKGGVPRYIGNSSRGSKTLSKTKLPVVPCEIQKKLVLPKVRSQEIVSKIQKNK